MTIPAHVDAEADADTDAAVPGSPSRASQVPLPTPARPAEFASPAASLSSRRRLQRRGDAIRTTTLFATLLVAISAVRDTRTTQAQEGPRPMRQPQRLEPGDTIMFVAPAGVLDRERMQLAGERLAQLGFVVKQRDDLFAEVGYLAGEDERRAAELMQAFRDPEVDAIFPGTGGFGTMRILELLDYETIRENPKVVIGFSDITALHAALNRRAGLVTFHSPNPMWGLGSPNNLTDFSAKWFYRGIFKRPVLAEAAAPPAAEPNGDYVIEIPPDVPQPVAWGTGRARGRLTGGNLSLISALEGTPYAIDARDAILLIEDTREAPYRVDRMLQQLKLAGKLSQIRGAILGQFTRNYDREEDQLTEDRRFSVDGVLQQYFGEAGIPVLMNYPIGHHEMNATLPLGGQVEVDAEAGVVRVLGF